MKKELNELKTGAKGIKKKLMKIGGAVLILLGVCIIAIVAVLPQVINVAMSVGTPEPIIAIEGYMNTDLGGGVSVQTIGIAAGAILIILGAIAIIKSKEGTK
jgi:hypothetical protein